MADDTSISKKLKYPDQLDSEDVSTPAPLHVLTGRHLSHQVEVIFCLFLSVICRLYLLQAFFPELPL